MQTGWEQLGDDTRSALPFLHSPFLAHPGSSGFLTGTVSAGAVRAETVPGGSRGDEPHRGPEPGLSSRGAGRCVPLSRPCEHSQMWAAAGECFAHTGSSVQGQVC